MKLVVAAAALIVSAGIAIAYQPAVGSGQQGSDAGEQRQPSFLQMGDRLLTSLKASPGCLGADAAQTRSGRNVIFAWFENKAAALEWYNGPTHTFVRKSFTDPTGEPYAPMEHVPDDVPVLVIASLKMGDKPLPGMRIPVSEIAIELYTPLPGGIRYAGGFSPQALEVPHRRDIAPPPTEPRQTPGEGSEPAERTPAGN